MENQNTTREMLTISKYDFDEECTACFLSGYYHGVKDVIKTMAKRDIPQVQDKESKGGAVAAVIITLGLPIVLVGAAVMAEKATRKKSKDDNRN